MAWNERAGAEAGGQEGRSGRLLGLLSRRRRPAAAKARDATDAEGAKGVKGKEGGGVAAAVATAGGMVTGAAEAGVKREGAPRDPGPGMPEDVAEADAGQGGAAGAPKAAGGPGSAQAERKGYTPRSRRPSFFAALSRSGKSIGKAAAAEGAEEAEEAPAEKDNPGADGAQEGTPSGAEQATRTSDVAAADGGAAERAAGDAPEGAEDAGEQQHKGLLSQVVAPVEAVGGAVGARFERGEEGPGEGEDKKADAGKEEAPPDARAGPEAEHAAAAAAEAGNHPAAVALTEKADKDAEPSGAEQGKASHSSMFARFSRRTRSAAKAGGGQEPGTANGSQEAATPKEAGSMTGPETEEDEKKSRWMLARRLLFPFLASIRTGEDAAGTADVVNTDDEKAEAEEIGDSATVPVATAAPVTPSKPRSTFFSRRASRRATGSPVEAAVAASHEPAVTSENEAAPSKGVDHPGAEAKAARADDSGDKTTRLQQRLFFGRGTNLTHKGAANAGAAGEAAAPPAPQPAADVASEAEEGGDTGKAVAAEDQAAAPDVPDAGRAEPLRQTLATVALSYSKVGRSWRVFGFRRRGKGDANDAHATQEDPDAGKAAGTEAGAEGEGEGEEGAKEDDGTGAEAATADTEAAAGRSSLAQRLITLSRRPKAAAKGTGEEAEAKDADAAAGEDDSVAVEDAPAKAEGDGGKDGGVTEEEMGGERAAEVPAKASRSRRLFSRVKAGGPGTAEAPPGAEVCTGAAGDAGAESAAEDRAGAASATKAEEGEQAGESASRWRRLFGFGRGKGANKEATEALETVADTGKAIPEGAGPDAPADSEDAGAATGDAARPHEDAQKEAPSKPHRRLFGFGPRNEGREAGDNKEPKGTNVEGDDGQAGAGAGGEALTPEAATGSHEAAGDAAAEAVMAEEPEVSVSKPQGRSGGGVHLFGRWAKAATAAAKPRVQAAAQGAEATAQETSVAVADAAKADAAKTAVAATGEAEAEGGDMRMTAWRRLFNFARRAKGGWTGDIKGVATIVETAADATAAEAGGAGEPTGDKETAQHEEAAKDDNGVSAPKGDCGRQRFRSFSRVPRGKAVTALEEGTEAGADATEQVAQHAEAAVEDAAGATTAELAGPEEAKGDKAAEGNKDKAAGAKGGASSSQRFKFFGKWQRTKAAAAAAEDVEHLVEDAGKPAAPEAATAEEPIAPSTAEEPMEDEAEGVGRKDAEAARAGRSLRRLYSGFRIQAKAASAAAESAAGAAENEVAKGGAPGKGADGEFGSQLKGSFVDIRGRNHPPAGNDADGEKGAEEVGGGAGAAIASDAAVDEPVADPSTADTSEEPEATRKGSEEQTATAVAGPEQAEQAQGEHKGWFSAVTAAILAVGGAVGGLFELDDIWDDIQEEQEQEQPGTEDAADAGASGGVAPGQRADEPGENDEHRPEQGLEAPRPVGLPPYPQGHGA